MTITLPGILCVIGVYLAMSEGRRLTFFRIRQGDALKEFEGCCCNQFLWKTLNTSVIQIRHNTSNSLVSINLSSPNQLVQKVLIQPALNGLHVELYRSVQGTHDLECRKKNRNKMNFWIPANFRNYPRSETCNWPFNRESKVVV